VFFILFLILRPIVSYNSSVVLSAQARRLVAVTQLTPQRRATKPQVALRTARKGPATYQTSLKITHQERVIEKSHIRLIEKKDHVAVTQSHLIRKSLPGTRTLPHRIAISSRQEIELLSFTWVMGYCTRAGCSTANWRF